MVIFIFFLVVCMAGEFYFTYRDMLEKLTGTQQKRTAYTVALVLGGSSCVLIMELVDIIFGAKIPNEIARTALAVVFMVVIIIALNVLAKALAEKKFKKMK